MKQFLKIFQFLVITMFVGVVYAGCKENPAGKANDSAELPGNTQPQRDTVIQGIALSVSDISFDSALIPRFLSRFPEFRPFASDYALFYRNRGYNYAWYDGQGIIEQAWVLLSHLQETDTSYISYRIPYRDTLHKMFRYDDDASARDALKADPTYELMLTGQYFNYAKKRWGQRLEGSQESIGWYIPRKKLDYSGLLGQVLEGKSYDSITNTVMNRYYIGLRKALNTFRALEKEHPGVLPQITYSKTLRPGDSSSVIPLVRQRLQMYGYEVGANGTNVYDPALSMAVNRYRRNLGLKQDSLISRDVTDALNVPIRKRIEQILVNLERLRWVPKVPELGDMILVNIPEYMLHYFEHGSKVWECNVVIGKPMTKTVIFSGDIRHVVFSPYWYVPPSIINKEVRPGMKRNPNYLAAHNMEWNGGNVRQKPGPRNSLGLVKFIFPNSNNIYLHDTPSKNLFNEDNRAFSHGCVRVGKPRDLAIRILRDDPAWTPAKIDAAMNAGTEKFVPVKKQLPVYIGYFTAFVDAEGALNFRKDIYNRDQHLYDMLTSGK
jgi:murein L,D-transpeptidase YcbB/YkuD